MFPYSGTTSAQVCPKKELQQALLSITKCVGSITNKHSRYL